MSDEPQEELDPEALPEVDLDEDLFSFDEIIAVAEGEDDRIDLEELLKVLNAEQPQPAPVEREEIDEEVIGDTTDVVRPAAPAEVVVQADGAPVTVTVPNTTSPRSLKVALALVAGASIINLAFFGVVWKSDSGVGETLQSIESRFLNRVVDIEQSLLSTAEAQAKSTLPYVAPEAGGRGTLNQIRDLLSDGQFDDARRRCYSLLAIVDRFDAEERNDIDAQCTFLLADSYRREAEQREREEEYR